MQKCAFWIALTALILVSLACGSRPAVDQIAPTLQAGLQTIAPTIKSAVETVQPTLEAGAATALPAAQTLFPLDPAKGLPLPGTLFPQVLNRLNEEQAALAIQAYGKDVLGVDVTVIAGRGVIGDLDLPVAVESGVTGALKLAGVSYFALLQDGGASLSLGGGTATGDLTTSIQDASLGIFSFSLAQAMPVTAEQALALVKATYPNLAGKTLVQVDSTQGFSFETAHAEDWAVAGGQVMMKGTVVKAGVAPGRRAGRVAVWVIVASGALSTPFTP